MIDSLPDNARKTVRAIRDAVVKLAGFPQAGRMIPEFQKPDCREIIVAPYRVMYRRKEKLNAHSSRLMYNVIGGSDN